MASRNFREAAREAARDATLASSLETPAPTGAGDQEELDGLFNWTVKADDTVSVRFEVYPSLEHGRRIPRILNRAEATAALGRLRAALEATEESLSGTDPEDTGRRLALENDVTFLQEAIAQGEANLARKTTEVIAVFRRPDWAMERRIERESHVHTMKEKVWDEGAHAGAIMRHLFVEWNLREPGPNGKPVPVPPEDHLKVEPVIFSAIIAQFHERVAFGSLPEEDAKN